MNLPIGKYTFYSQVKNKYTNKIKIFYISPKIIKHMPFQFTILVEFLVLAAFNEKLSKYLSSISKFLYTTFFFFI